jgi:3-hydroxyisobutyrate dehydrogenase
MAGRLLSANFPLAVYNRKLEKALRFGDAGAFIAGSPREAASRGEIIISMVADDAASRDMWLGPDGALAGASAGSVLIESSTLTVEWIKELVALAAQRKCELLDAPVTGTRPHAASGELTFLVGGSASALEKAQPAFSVLGREVLHLGANGSGALMKLINNFLCGVQAASFAEAEALIKVAGLDRDKAVALLTSGAPGSGLVKRVAVGVPADDPTPNFLLRLMAKDLNYALESSSAKGITLQTAASALAIFKQAIAKGHGDEDFSAVVKAFQ